MPERVGSHCRLFADDSIIYREISNDQDRKILQDDLEKLERWEKDWGMSFNPSKCNIMHVSRKLRPLISSYFLKGEQLESVDSAKYLGVNIAKDVTWHNHTLKTSTKSNQTLGFIKRNIPKSAPTPTKEMAYKTLVRPLLEYSSCVWAPHQQFLQNKIEMVQHRAARYVLGFPPYSQDSVTLMLKQLNWDTLEQRRLKAKAIMTYKILHNLVGIPSTQYVPQSSHNTRGGEFKLRQLHCNKDYYKFSFFPSSIPLWNSIPANVICSPDIVTFRNSIATLHLAIPSY